MSYARGKVSMSVPAAWVGEATLPITVDPIIGSPFIIDEPILSPSDYQSEVSFNTADQTYLVTWNDLLGAGTGLAVVHAQRFSSDGQALGSLLALGYSSALYGSVSYAPAPVNRWLVAWSEGHSTPTSHSIEGCVINGDGTVFKPDFAVDDRPLSDYDPRVAFDGTNWHVSWSNGDPTDANSVWTVPGRFVSADGVVLQAADVEPVGAAHLFSSSVVFGSGRYAFIWRVGTTSGTGHVYARTMDPSGTLSPIVELTETSTATNFVDVSYGGGKYLFSWVSTSSQITGRIADPTLQTIGSSFNLGFGFCSRVAYSPASARWVVASTTFSGLRAATVDPSGVVTPAELLATVPGHSIEAVALDVNPTANEALITYTAIENGGGIDHLLLGVRYQVPSPGGLQGRWKFDEGTGTVAHDSSGMSNDGTLQNGVTWTAGKSGTAVSFNGSNQYISVPATGMPSATGAQTISWWMNYDSVPSGNQCVIGLTNDAVGSAVQCGFRNGQLTVWKFGGGVLAQAPAPSTGAWHNFAYTFDGTTHRLYIEGTEVSSSVAAPQTAVPDKVEFGRWSGGSEYYAGKLDEVSIYGQVLSASQIADQAALDPSVKAYFKFNEGAGTFTADSSGNGHNGTLNSGVIWAPGRSGTAAAFDGSSGSVACVLGTGLPANNAPQTISWWMNYPTVGGVQAAVCLTNPGAGSAIQAGFRNGVVTVWNWGGNTLVSAPAPATNSWHHFAYTFDGTTHTLYVDGVSANTSTASAQTAAPSRLDFGFTPGWGEFFTGKLDEVRIYDRALGVAEVGAQARVYSLEAYFKFDEGVGPQTADSTGNGHDGTLNGTVWAVGRSGAALSFDGTASNVSCALGSGLPANNANQTTSWWMNYCCETVGVRHGSGIV
jgi:hypothetical protein